MSPAFCSNNLNERPRSHLHKSCARTAAKLPAATGSIRGARREHIDPCPVQSVGISPQKRADEIKVERLSPAA